MTTRERDGVKQAPDAGLEMMGDKKREREIQALINGQLNAVPVSQASNSSSAGAAFSRSLLLFLGESWRG